MSDELTNIIPTSIKLEDLIQRMSSCPQGKTQNVLQHGQSVWQHFTTLLGHLKHDEPLPAWWRVPGWANNKAILDELPPAETLKAYATYHDCGKPFCRIVDETGRQHFPGHAEISERVWLAAGGDPLAARLIGMDMDAHLLRADGIEEFAGRPEAPALQLMAIAEVHSNAAMFGGENSDSFKIKAKHLEHRGGQVMKRRAENR